jgi:hypothetical protein
MSLTTYADLKTYIAGVANRSDQTDNIPVFISWAHQEINRRLRSNLMLASADLTISAETVTAPTGFLAFKRVYLDSSPRRELKTTSAEGAMDLSAGLGTQTYPTHVAVEGTSLRFAPLFTGTATGKALYYKAQTAMSADGDTNAVFTAYPFLYVFGAMEALSDFLEDDAGAQKWGGKFGALIEDINSRDAKDTMAGPIQAQPYPGGVV